MAAFFFFNDTATTEIYTLSLHDALPIYPGGDAEQHRERHDAHERERGQERRVAEVLADDRSEEHTSELQSLAYLVCRLLLEKKKRTTEAAESRGRGPAAIVAGHRHNPRF